jgi:putative two-component system response regulator
MSMSSEMILVVEDNDITRQGIKIVLETDGFAVITAIHGLDALDQMEKSRPDLILCDISMPVMDGFAFFDIVRKRIEWVSIPFIFLTARGSREDVFEGKKAGVEDYLIKPVDRKELLTTVHSRLTRNQQILLAQLSQAYQSSLIMLANAIELRDEYAQGHVERVTEFGMSIGRQMGLPPACMGILKLGCILHDIGKIQIREEVLRKKGPLTEDEWTAIKQHPIVGAELIKNVPYLVPAVPVIRHHHEHWDGTGYPDGIARGAIPIEARILAVADALDAMTTAKIYRRARSKQAAFREIVQLSGIWYDPDVVTAFRAAWGDIKQRLLLVI